ncbi:hypothetical protein EUGRSUZ_H02933 [Eucalyptus grandis]|uniref:Uncharacterized protein n=2 Tax=Eucalyptus grandis TaxID=71139 RepID=A0ACC3JSX7_EUCGR|nr:hypothetical protein EUGRSUZ_H02933 [Eucalyptus grandis]
MFLYPTYLPGYNGSALPFLQAAYCDKGIPHPIFLLSLPTVRTGTFFRLLRTYFPFEDLWANFGITLGVSKSYLLSDGLIIVSCRNEMLSMITWKKIWI